MRTSSIASTNICASSTERRRIASSSSFLESVASIKGESSRRRNARRLMGLAATVLQWGKRDRGAISNPCDTLLARVRLMTYHYRMKMQWDQEERPVPDASGVHPGLDLHRRVSSSCRYEARLQRHSCLVHRSRLRELLRPRVGALP